MDLAASRLVRSGIIARLATLAIMLFSARAFAHPMGNLSISHYAGIHIRPDSVELDYLIDMAEIPTFQEMQQSGMPADSGDPEVRKYLRLKATNFAQGLSLIVDGRVLVLEPVSQQAIFPQGAGNLPTMKMGFVYRARLPESCRGTACELSYNDSNFSGRAGWKEIVISALPGVHRDDGAAFSVDRSSRLTDYPTDLVNSPPQDVTAKIVFTVAAPVLAKPRSEPVAIAAPQPAPKPVEMTPAELKPNRQAPPRNAFTELMTRKEISFRFVLIAALIAAGLGALHAMEPGHGKTIVAAYLVGSKGTGRHAVLLGLIVTVSHTAGVYLLGAVTLYAQKYIMPDRLYPYLSVISGILIAGMGIYILLKRIAGDEFASHVHGPEGHSHGVLLEKFGRKQLMILGVTGGMVPCPAALVVLLSAVALHRVGFGLFLIVAFSMGLAAVLIGMGLAAVYAGRLISRVPVEGRVIRLWMPAASAAMITILGFAIAIRGLMAAGIVQIRI
jgi:nickel/cobalt exporter